jgi:hypothetical protein
MTTTSPAATSCDSHSPELSAADNLAAAIAFGNDLGVFELGNALAKAREVIPVGSSPRTYAAVRAAIGVRLAFDKVATAIYSLDVPHATCPCCDLRKQLDELIEIAAKAEGPGPLADVCRDLACYAGDDHPDADATRVVLELARDVFVAGVVELYRDE